MPAVGGDRRRRAAREPLAGDRRRRRRPAPRYRLLDSIRAFALEAMDGGRADRPRPRRARRVVRRRGRDVDATACAARARPSTSRSPAPSARTSTPRWPGARRTTRCARSRSSTGSAGRGSCSATAAARSGSWPRSTPRASGAGRRPRGGAAARGAGSRRRPGDLEPARRHVERRDRAGRAIDDRPAGALRLPPRLRRLAPRRVGAGAGAHRARRRYEGLDRPVGPGGERAVRRAGRDLGRRPRRAPPRRATRSSAGSRRVDDPWLHVRRDAMLGELARVEHRFDDAVATSAGRRRRRAGSASCRPRPTSSRASAARSARPATTRRARRRSSSRSTKAEATGDVRLAALARVHLGRVLRALGRDGARRGRRSRRPRRGTATPAAASRPRSATACSRRSTPRTACPARTSGSPRSATPRARRRRAGRGLRPRRARAARRAGGRRRPRGSCTTPPTAAWRPPRTSSPSATGSTRARSGSRLSAPRWCSPTKASSPPMTIAMPTAWRLVDDLAEQQERPHDRERRLRDLGDPDRADLDRLLRVHEQSLRRDPAREA